MVYILPFKMGWDWNETNSLACLEKIIGPLQNKKVRVFVVFFNFYFLNYLPTVLTHLVSMVSDEIPAVFQRSVSDCISFVFTLALHFLLTGV